MLNNLNIKLSTKILIKNGEPFANPNNTCETCICKDGHSYCVPDCAETKDTCLQKSNKTVTYEWIDPVNGSCCGQCNQVSRKFYFSLIFRLLNIFKFIFIFFTLINLNRSLRKSTRRMFVEN